MKEPNPIRPFQFIVRRLLPAVACFSAGFALASIVLRVWQIPANLIGLFEVLAAFFCPFAVMALFGAGIGQLLGSALEGAGQGILACFLLFVFFYLGPGVTQVIWQMF